MNNPEKDSYRPSDTERINKVNVYENDEAYMLNDDKENEEKLRKVDAHLKKYVESTYQLLPESLRIEGGVKFDWFDEGADFEVAYSRPYVMNYVVKPTDTMSSQQ